MLKRPFLGILRFHLPNSSATNKNYSPKFDPLFSWRKSYEINAHVKLDMIWYIFPKANILDERKSMNLSITDSVFLPFMKETVFSFSTLTFEVDFWL